MTKDIDWGIAVLVMSGLVWLLEKTCLKLIIALRSQFLPFLTASMFIVIEIGLIVGVLYVIIMAKKLTKKPTLWAAIIALLWTIGRLVTIIVAIIYATIKHS